jgi:anti-sigma-K factor RskA
MALNDQDIEKIEQYLLGELTREEKGQVEERIKNNSEFAEEVEFMRDVIIATQEKGKEEVDQIFGNNDQENTSKDENKAEVQKNKNDGSNKKKIINMLNNWIKRIKNN